MNGAAIGLIAAVAAACITALGAIIVARVGRRTDQESQGVKALAESVDGFRDLLEQTRIEHERKLKDLQDQADRRADEQTALQKQADKRAAEQATAQEQLAERVQHLEKALAAARRYIDSLLFTLRSANVDPPDPPSDYTH